MNFFRSLAERFVLMLKWLVLSFVLGIVLGILGGGFAQSITLVTKFRNMHPWMLYLLPAAGLLIVFIYSFDPWKTGTNTVINGVRDNSEVPVRMAGMIVASTVLTHAAGGSAGREGAALQLGGGIASGIAKVLKLNENDRRILLMCGMAAGFSALFGTPLTAAIFALEVVNVGSMQYAALLPCAFSALIAKQTAVMIGTEGEGFLIPDGIAFSLTNAGKIVVLAMLAALCGILFCKVLHATEHYSHKWIENPYLRAVAGGTLVIILAKVLGTADYLGAGMNIIELAAEGEVVPYAFLLKIVFTSLTLGTGYKGGEIVPALFIGGTFGSVFSLVTGINPALGTCCGMAASFCAVSNCPVSSLMLSFELFGFTYMPFFLLTCAAAYLISGDTGLYHSQIQVYSRTSLKEVNIHTEE